MKVTWFVEYIIRYFKKYDNKCGVMLSSSIQATLLGRYAGSDYGKSKLAGEELFLIMLEIMVVRYMYIVFLIYLVNGVDLIITVQ